MVAQQPPADEPWRGYFGFCETPGALQKLDAWIRRCFRCFLWKQRKQTPTRFQELTARGVNQQPCRPDRGFTPRCLAAEL
nr:group II intron maturase-specific domain-containing protein [Burkholderia sp. BDU5]